MVIPGLGSRPRERQGSVKEHFKGAAREQGRVSLAVRRAMRGNTATHEDPLGYASRWRLQDRLRSSYTICKSIRSLYLKLPRRLKAEKTENGSDGTVALSFLQQRNIFARTTRVILIPQSSASPA